MSITDAIMARVGSVGVETILADLLPAVHRMAHGLTGDARAGGIVARHVLRRAVDRDAAVAQGNHAGELVYHDSLLPSRDYRPPTES